MISESEFLTDATEIFRAELDDETLQLSMSSSQADIPEWDSLASVRIVMRFEAKYGIQFEVDEIEAMTSVKSIHDAVSRHRV